MSEALLLCKNHPSIETRVRCSSCSEPICTRCMRQSAVGMKCPECAAVPKSALRMGKPRHYLLGAGAGIAAATAVGLVTFWLGFGLRGLLFPLLAGALTGSAVRSASGLGHGRMQVVTAISTMAGLSVAALLFGATVQSLMSVRWLVGAGLAAAAAVWIVRR